MWASGWSPTMAAAQTEASDQGERDFKATCLSRPRTERVDGREADRWYGWWRAGRVLIGRFVVETLVSMIERLEGLNETVYVNFTTRKCIRAQQHAHPRCPEDVLGRVTLVKHQLLRSNFLRENLLGDGLVRLVDDELLRDILMGNRLSRCELVEDKRVVSTISRDS